MRDRVHNGKQTFGEDHISSILTEKEVRRIRLLWDQGVSMTRMGKKFGVSTGAVRKIIRNETWIGIGT
jgi:predicted DNA-binding protein YlxM (UPF0122 family)